jgi:hypothetical protein
MITGTIKTSEPAATTEKTTVPALPAVAAGSDDLVRDLLVDIGARGKTRWESRIQPRWVLLSRKRTMIA